MNAITLYLIGSGASVLLSWILVHILRGSLAELLEELWSSRARAGFWAAVGCVSLLLLGVFSGTGTSGYQAKDALQGDRGFFALASQLRWTMAGLFVALMALSFFVMLFMLSKDRATRGEARVPRSGPLPETRPQS